MTTGVLIAALVLATVACGASVAGEDKPQVAAEESAPFRILPDPEFGASRVSPRHPAGMSVTGGTLSSVRLTSEDGAGVDGRLDGDRWLASEPLAFGTRYRWQGSAVDEKGERYPISGSFRTLEPERLVTSSANVVDGGVYPNDLRIAVTFNAPVENRGDVARVLRVSTTPRTQGRWSWSDDARVVTWEAASGWRPGTKVQVDGRLYGVSFGAGGYGADDMRFGFRIQAG